LGRYDVKRILAEVALLKNDLLEILALWPEELKSNKLKAKLALACLQLMVPLTWPLELDDEKTTVNHHRHLPFLQLAQVGYKRAILQYEHAQILRTVVRLCLPAMAVERRERSKRDEGILKLVLYLFRNVAMITQPQMLPSQGDENEISRSATIDAFADQDVFTLLLTIGSGASDEFQDEDVILLEILFHLVKGVDAKKLFLQEKQLQSSAADELRLLMQKEKAMHGSYNKSAPTRHNRFGTMIWVKRDDQGKVSTVSGQKAVIDEASTLQQMDSTKKWNKPKPRSKNATEPDSSSEFSARVDLTESARKKLRRFVEDFLDSGFNPLFSSLRRAIEREAERLLESHKRQYYYLIHWFLKASEARRAGNSRSDSGANPANTDVPEIESDNAFAYIAAVLDQETFVLLNRTMQRAFDEKNWTELQATLRAFTQILLTVQSMAESKDEEDQEIAENIQNRIFYEATTHDRLVQILRTYNNQGFTYLDTVTECVHVFVRMLERYSKINVDMHIRSKRRSRRKARKSGNEQPSNEEGVAQDEEDEREAHATVTERKFDFARFSAKFLTQPCLDTYISFLHYYTDLTSDQLKRCHKYLYRLAFKHELTILLFRVDIMLLLHRMIKGDGSGGGALSKEAEEFRDWEQLIQQVFRRCIKWLTRSTEGEGWMEACVVEMLFSKMPGTMFYLQNGYERVVEKRPPRAPAELEFKASVDDGKKVPVAVSLLLEKGEGGTLDWVKKELEGAVTERKAWREMEEARTATTNGSENEEQGEKPQAPTVFLSPDTDERKTALFKDKHLRLLLTTLGFERLGLAEDTDASWIIPSSLSSDDIQISLDNIKKTEFEGLTLDEGQTAANMVRNKSSSSTRRRSERGDAEGLDLGSDDDEGGVSDPDEAMFPPNLREKRRKGDEDEDRPTKRRRLINRKTKELTDAELQERADARRRREKERNSKIKSALYVTAEDDESDEEADAQFFAMEEQRRKKMAGLIRSALLEEARGGEKASKKAGKKGGKKGKKAREEAVEVESDGVQSDVDMDDVSVTSSRRRRQRSHIRPAEDSEDEEMQSDPESQNGDAKDDELDADEQETPSSSQPPAPGSEESGEQHGKLGPESATGGALAEVNGNTIPVRSAGRAAVEDEDEDNAPIVKPVPRRHGRLRAGFIIDDEDSDE
jgi:replication fork protection complex subunit Tof1/Swi1